MNCLPLAWARARWVPTPWSHRLVVSFPGNNTTLLTYFDTGDDRIVKKTSLPGGVSWSIAADQRTAAGGFG